MQREPGKKERVEGAIQPAREDEDASEKSSTEKRTDERTDEKVVLDQLQASGSDRTFTAFSACRPLIITRACMYSTVTVIKT